MNEQKQPLIIENAYLMFRNFSGEKGQYNKNGDKNFCVRIDDPELADQLAKDSWNVRMLDPKEEGNLPTYYLPVAVSYEYRPPRITMYRDHRSIEMSLDNVGELDAEHILQADVVINPSSWNDNGTWRIKAYLSRLCVVVENDPFAEKYAQYNR